MVIRVGDLVSKSDQTPCLSVHAFSSPRQFVGRDQARFCFKLTTCDVALVVAVLHRVSPTTGSFFDEVLLLNRDGCLGWTDIPNVECLQAM